MASFESKDEARESVWEALTGAGKARFPFPVRGRIPNFEGAEEAAARLFEEEPWASADVLKVNPDAPQRHVRARALAEGRCVLVPTPRLRDGFLLLDPARIPREEHRAAATISGADRLGRRVPLRRLPRVDAIVAGSVAVTADGRRCGKGGGYGDLEFAVLVELGHEPAPVATTVHDLQVVGGLPREPHDLPLALVVTPTRTLRPRRPPPAPKGICWDLVSERDLEQMPVLAELRRRP